MRQEAVQTGELVGHLVLQRRQTVG